MIDFTLSQNNDTYNASVTIWMTKNGITESQFKRIYTFLKNPELFYNTYCPSLVKYAIREKRFLDFETPNRVQITHEYDIRLIDIFEFNQYYYLFNPYNRLGWLKIRQGIDRITIAKSTVIQKIVIKALISELIMFDNPPQNNERDLEAKEGFAMFYKVKQHQSIGFYFSYNLL